MLTGAEWTCAVKINAHCRPERKTIPPQLCKAGGGGASGTQNRSDAFPLRKEGHAWPHFSECAFILTTSDPLSFSDRDLPVPSSPPFLCRATPDGFLRVSVRARWPAPSSPRAWRCPGLTAPFSGTCMDPGREIYAGARLCHTLSLDRALTCLFVGTCGNLSGTCGELVCLFVGTRGYSFIDRRILRKFFY